MSRLGDLIHLERTRRKLPAKQIAKKCGVSEQYLLDVELGKRIIADDQARRILKVMGLSEQNETDFNLDDIAATVDLQSAVPQLQKAVAKPAQKAQPIASTADEKVSGSIWLDALSGVLKHVPVYNAVMKEVDHRLMAVTDGKIEGAAPDKVYYFVSPDNTMRGFRVMKGDYLLTMPAASPVDGAIMVLQTPTGRALRKVKTLERCQVMLQTYDHECESEIKNISDCTFLGRCVRLEAEI